MSNEQSQALKYWLGFNFVKGIGPAKIQALLDFFGNIEAAWHANGRQMQQIGIDRRTIEGLPTHRRGPAPPQTARSQGGRTMKGRR
jgi:predicted Rossmann fold nucleotide-binding protein DprA/Smf involved in DNA uptake